MTVSFGAGCSPVDGVTLNPGVTPFPGLTGTPATLYATAASDFGGAAYFARGAGLTGAADGKKGTVSMWVRPASLGTTRLLCAVNSLGGSVVRETFGFATQAFQVQLRNSGGTVILQMNSSLLTQNVWQHLAATWDLAAALGQIYVNGVADTAVTTTLTNDTIDYTMADWGIGGTPGGASICTGCLSELWFDPTTSTDFSVAANLAKFISAGRPVSLGANGSTPTGSQPILYVPSGDPSGAGNKGTGGAFTATGVVTVCASSPSG